METLDIRREITRLPLFAGLAPPDLERVCDTAEPAVVPRGGAIYRQGDVPRHLPILLRGQVKVVRRSSRGRDLICDVDRAPAVLAEVGAYTERPYLMSAVALERCSVARLPRPVLRTMIESSPALAVRFLEMLQQRYARLSADIDELTGRSVEHRLASLVCRLRGDEETSRSGETFVPLSLTRRELADLVSSTTDALGRILARWRNAGVIATASEGIIVRHWAPIEKLAFGGSRTLSDVWPGPGEEHGRPGGAPAAPPVTEMTD